MPNECIMPSAVLAKLTSIALFMKGLSVAILLQKCGVHCINVKEPRVIAKKDKITDAYYGDWTKPP